VSVGGLAKSGCDGVRRYAEPDKGWTDMHEKRWPVPYWDIDTGLGAVCFGISDQAKLRETFGVPQELTAIGTIAIGYAKPHDRPSLSLKRGHRPAEQVIHKGNW
jgi:hypothetical protein